MTEEWPCEAYGEESLSVGMGAVCFVSGMLDRRVCDSAAECHRQMIAERRRLFDRIRAGAAEGNPVMIDLAAEFTDPSQLLGGDAAGYADRPPDGFR